jgi:uncharacterized phiE125 gp8 family phage protein
MLEYNWTQSQPTPASIWTTDQLAYALRIDSDLSGTTDEQDYLTDLQNAAVEYAEQAMGTSLLTRTITTTYYGYHRSVYSALVYPTGCHKLYLPRGPIISISSVTDANGAISNYQVSGAGTTDLIEIKQQWVGPLVIVYQAGYGDDASTIPADIRQAIRTHVATLYENRESISDKPMTEVPQSLKDFYQLKARYRGVA